MALLAPGRATLQALLGPTAVTGTAIVHDGLGCKTPFGFEAFDGALLLGKFRMTRLAIFLEDNLVLLMRERHHPRVSAGQHHVRGPAVLGDRYAGCND